MTLFDALLQGINMQIDNDRARLRKLIIEQTELPQVFAQRIAEEKIHAARSLAGIKSSPVSPTDIQSYILGHHDEIEKAVGNVVEELCRKILPEERISDLIKQFGVLSLFLVPPLAALVAVAMRDFQIGALPEAAGEAVGALLLFALLIASALAVFRKERKEK